MQKVAVAAARTAFSLMPLDLPSWDMQFISKPRKIPIFDYICKKAVKTTETLSTDERQAGFMRTGWDLEVEKRAAYAVGSTGKIEQLLYLYARLESPHAKMSLWLQPEPDFAKNKRNFPNPMV